ncbi:MAG: YceI family protein [Burkholderiales bacterium]
MNLVSKTLLASLLPLSAWAAPTTYMLDPTHTIPYFAVNHLGMSTVQGHFERTSGNVTLDVAAKTGAIELKVPTATISTGDGKRSDGTRSRDDHLRSADFFNVAEFPEMVFKSTKFNFKGDKPETIEGTLTLLGVSKQVKLAVVGFNCGANPMSKQQMCGADLAGTIKRSDYGMKYGVPAIGDDIKLTIAVEAYKQ